MMRAFLSQLSSLLLALILSLVVWAVATNEDNPNREGVFQDPIAIEYVNLPDNMVLYQKSADTVRVRLTAPDTRWGNLRATDFRALVDLHGLTPGVHQLRVQISTGDPFVRLVSTTPSDVSINLQTLGTAFVIVRAQVVDDPPVGYEYRTPSVSPEKVTITGPQNLVSQVLYAVAPIGIRGAKSPLEREVAVTLQDEQGAPVIGLTTTPPTVTVQLPILQRVGYKEVAIKPVLKGTVAPGYWISNITVQPNTATLVGPPEALAKIAGFVETQPIEVTDRSAFIIQRANVVLPDGVSMLRDNGDITVRVTIDPQLGGQTVRRKLRLINLRKGLSANISPDTIDVILSGPLPTLQSLTANDVSPVLDLANLGPGTYQLKAGVQLVPSSLKVESLLPDTVEVIISGQEQP